MKTIIIPTDFSPAATNAVNYGVDMALSIDASVLLLHVYNIPVAYGDVPVALISIDEMKKAAEDNIESLKRDLQHITSGKLQINTETRLGSVIDELEDLCTEIQPFAVVMGTAGYSAVERTLFGSNTLKAIKHLSCPVICVPVGKELGKFDFSDQLLNNVDGSCMIVVATDAPLANRNLLRLAKRAMLGLGKTGGIASNGSGDYVIAFSTSEELRVPHASTNAVTNNPGLQNDETSPLFMAAIEATEEAIINSLFAAKTTIGRKGNKAEALPLDKVIPILKKYNRLQ